MDKIIRILVAIILTIVLAIGGFFAGYQIKVETPVESPMHENQIIMTVSGAAASECTEYVRSKLVANRLVENLMLQCTPDDLREKIRVEVTGDNSFLVTAPMDEEGQMAYFAEELTYILNEEIRKEAEDVNITVTDQRLVTVDAEKDNSIAVACIGAGIGVLLGILISAVLLLTGKKHPGGKYSKN